MSSTVRPPWPAVGGSHHAPTGSTNAVARSICPRRSCRPLNCCCREPTCSMSGRIISCSSSVGVAAGTGGITGDFSSLFAVSSRSVVAAAALAARAAACCFCSSFKVRRRFASSTPKVAGCAWRMCSCTSSPEARQWWHAPTGHWRGGVCALSKPPHARSHAQHGLLVDTCLVTRLLKGKVAMGVIRLEGTEIVGYARLPQHTGGSAMDSFLGGAGDLRTKGLRGWWHPFPRRLRLSRPPSARFFRYLATLLPLSASGGPTGGGHHSALLLDHVGPDSPQCIQCRGVRGWWPTSCITTFGGHLFQIKSNSLLDGFDFI